MSEELYIESIEAELEDLRATYNTALENMRERDRTIAALHAERDELQRVLDMHRTEWASLLNERYGLRDELERMRPVFDSALRHEAVSDCACIVCMAVDAYRAD